MGIGRRTICGWAERSQIRASGCTQAVDEAIEGVVGVGLGLAAGATYFGIGWYQTRSKAAI